MQAYSARSLAMVFGVTTAFLLWPTDLTAQDTCTPADVLDVLNAPYLTDDEDKRVGSSSVHSMPSGFPRPFIPAIGRIEVVYKIGNSECARWCTGSLIDDKHVLTAHHCLPGKSGTVVRARIRFGFDNEDIAAHKGQVLELLPAPEPMNSNIALDYSVVRLKNADNVKSRFGIVPLNIADPAPNEAITIVHHASGLPQRYSSGCHIAQTSSEAKFSHSCITDQGSSGAPIFGLGSLKLVGIHTERNGGYRIRSIAADSSIIQTTMNSGKGRAPGNVPVALLRGTYVILGQKGGLGDVGAETGVQRAPFGKKALQWLVDGNPLTGERLKVLFPAEVRSKHPQVGNLYGRTIAKLSPGMYIRVRSVVPVYTRAKSWKDMFYWGHIEQVECGEKTDEC